MLTFSRSKTRQKRKRRHPRTCQHPRRIVSRYFFLFIPRTFFGFACMSRRLGLQCFFPSALSLAPRNNSKVAYHIRLTSPHLLLLTIHHNSIHTSLHAATTMPATILPPQQLQESTPFCTECPHCEMAAAQLGSRPPHEQDAQTCSLSIRGFDGKSKRYSFSSDQTLQDVRKELKKKASQLNQNYAFVSLFPTRKLKETVPLNTLGLCPSASLLLKRMPPKLEPHQAEKPSLSRDLINHEQSRWTLSFIFLFVSSSYFYTQDSWWPFITMWAVLVLVFRAIRQNHLNSQTSAPQVR